MEQMTKQSNNLLHIGSCLSIGFSQPVPVNNSLCVVKQMIFRNNLRSLICKICKKQFKQSSPSQKYCGSYLKKTGCSYKNKLDNVKNKKLILFYNLSKEKYKDILDKQKNRCAICRLEKKLCVDHSHVDLKVRGLLCMQCNIAIGLLKDDVTLFKRSIKYLNI